MPLPFSLKKNDTGRLLEFSKGIAILLIILHHLSRSIWSSRGLPLPALQQWNFDPAGEGSGLLVATARGGHFSDLWLLLSAQFGYVGVHLFVLLSGLGLAIGTRESDRFLPFMKRRIRKIVPPFWTAVAFSAVLAKAFGTPLPADYILKRLFLLTTFDQRIFFGFDTPLWCMAVFFQLYILFLPLRWLINHYGPRILLLFALISFVARWAMSTPPVLRWNMYFGHAFALNWLAVFGLGVWIGCKLRRDGEIVLPVWTVTGTTLTAVLLLVLSETFKAAYPIHDTAIGVVTGAAVLLVWSVLSKTNFAAALAVVGSVSFPIYLYHRPLVSIVVYYWHKGLIMPFLPASVLAFDIVAALIVAALLMRRLMLLKPNIANMAFGENLDRAGGRINAPIYSPARVYSPAGD